MDTYDPKTIDWGSTFADGSHTLITFAAANPITVEAYYCDPISHQDQDQDREPDNTELGIDFRKATKCTMASPEYRSDITENNEQRDKRRHGPIRPNQICRHHSWAPDNIFRAMKPVNCSKEETKLWEQLEERWANLASKRPVELTEAARELLCELQNKVDALVDLLEKLPEKLQGAAAAAESLEMARDLPIVQKMQHLGHAIGYFLGLEDSGKSYPVAYMVSSPAENLIRENPKEWRDSTEALGTLRKDLGRLTEEASKRPGLVNLWIFALIRSLKKDVIDLLQV